MRPGGGGAHSLSAQFSIDGIGKSRRSVRVIRTLWEGGRARKGRRRRGPSEGDPEGDPSEALGASRHAGGQITRSCVAWLCLVSVCRLAAAAAGSADHRTPRADRHGGTPPAPQFHFGQKSSIACAVWNLIPSRNEAWRKA